MVLSLGWTQCEIKLGLFKNPWKTTKQTVFELVKSTIGVVSSAILTKTYYHSTSHPHSNDIRAFFVPLTVCFLSKSQNNGVFFVRYLN